MLSPTWVKCRVLLSREGSRGRPWGGDRMPYTGTPGAGRLVRGGRATCSAQLNRATAVAREYDSLMGLGPVALGAGFMGAALTGGQPGVWIALGLIFYGVILAWYYRRLGFAPPRHDRMVRLLAGTAIVVAVSGAAVVATPLTGAGCEPF